ncbi:O-antigen polymerase [Acinetobacter johnsonii]|uniref:O-antigen polymerase n=1 Tax=Acinetobacter johnsonii TaxID=40214 RepID=UPI00191A43CF|nr:O-antigen polymerase [Acinetobacter johnsonii]QQT59136.1 oligosaccharide repeat unit polymerase [Acinetobacter johnsonii]
MEFSILFLILSFFLSFPLLILKKKHFGRVVELNYFNVWFIVFILLAFIGALITTLGGAKESYFISGILYKENVVQLGSLFVLWSGIGMFYSFIVFLLVIDSEGKLKWENFVNKKIDDELCEYIVILFFSIFSFFSFLYYQVQVYPSPTFLALNGDALGAAIRRIEITKNLNLYANTYIIAFGTIISQIFSIQLVIRAKNNLKEKLLKYFMILISISFLITTSEKAPIVFYLFSIYMAYTLTQKKILKLNFRIILYFAILLFSIYYFFVSNDLVEIKKLIFERIFFAQMAIVYYSVDYYNSSNFIGIGSLGGFFNKLFDISKLPPSSETLMQVYFNEMIESGGWNMNGIYISEAWSNFGWFGVILGPIYVGIVIGILYIILARTKTSFGKALLVFATCSSFSFLTSFNIYLYNTIFVLLVVIIILRYFMLQVLKK